MAEIQLESMMKIERKPPVLGFYGFSNSGKTTLLERIIPRLMAKGLRVGTIKQTHHCVSADREGKDTWRHRQAGAESVILSSDIETALFFGRKLNLSETIELLTSTTKVDVVLLEGWKDESIPKVFLGGEGDIKPGTVMLYDNEIEPILELIEDMLME
ncbi:MAG: molybdopterin-guanine dinucleotide biosynthesis protein B [Candidatus Poseidoniaceae archaeon]|nr:molybdopterin-guanine dinucleotide biosynthesis protein B [Candidatus Poseidoniaceae archaeon]MDP7312168.1 molybdopterin-guanine dinucleotide biosynthesis protein B [Candidatus Thalassarchaeaceae archaeon]